MDLTGAMAVSIDDAGFAGGVLPDVDAHFSIGTLPDPHWRVLDVTITEALSQLATCTVRVRAEWLTTDELRSVLRQPASLTLSRGAAMRTVRGVVARVDQGPSLADGDASLVFTVVPSLWLLSLRRDSRVFHHANAIEIVRRVLHEAGLYPGEALQLRVEDDGRGGPYTLREYCVQYQETDLDFVQRLLESEGVAWYLEDHDQAETLVLSDGGRAALTGSYPSAGVIPLLEHREIATARGESLGRFGCALAAQPDGVALRDYDFTNVGRLAVDTRESPARVARTHAHRYEYPAGFLYHDLEDEQFLRTGLARSPAAPPHEAPRYDGHSGARLATVRAQELRASETTYDGEGNATTLGAGSRFSLQDLCDGSHEGEYLVTRIEHRFHAGDAAIGGAGAQPRYTNTFRCVSIDTPFRPPRVTPAPRIDGVQTAIVVGPAGEEIHTEFHGRVKIRFQWDRRASERWSSGSPPGHDPEPPHAYCWARVAQTWAGAGWGMSFVPRVGMEVVVTFLHGNPDLPMVVGCVYNGANTAPYALPHAATQSVIRTRSTPDVPNDERYNELRFEDARDREEIHVRAQRDLTTWVGHDRHTVVVGSESHRVAATQTLEVSGVRRMTVGEDLVESIEGDRTSTVAGTHRRTVAGDDRVTVVGAQRVTVMGGSHTTIAGACRTRVSMPHAHPDEPDHGGASNRPASQRRFLVEEHIEGNARRRVEGVEHANVDARHTHVQHDDELIVEHDLVLNAGGSMNLLVGSLTDPGGLATGLYCDASTVRLGTRRAEADELDLFRGPDSLRMARDEVVLEVKDKPIVLKVGDGASRIVLRPDGSIEIVAKQGIELRSEQGSRVTIGHDVSVQAAGRVKLSGGG